MKFDPLLLGEFAKKQELDFIIHDGEDEEVRADRFLGVIDNQNKQKHGEVLTALNDISDMSGWASVEYLQITAERLQKQVDWDVYDELPNHHSRALWFFLNHEDIFNTSVDEHELDNICSWKSVVVPDVDVATLTNGITTLEQAIQEMFTFGRRKTRCKIKLIEKPDRICMVAYVEDRFVNDLKFEEDDKLKPDTPRRPILRAYIQYWLEDKKLEVKIKGGQPKVEGLHRAVVEDVLELRYEDCKTCSYKLGVLASLDPDPLSVAEEQNVDSVELKAMNLRYRPNGSKLHLTIGSDSKGGVESMKSALKYRNINFDFFDILQAKIKVVFKINGKNRPVTFDVTHGKGHNLKSREQDMLVRKLLIKWGIDTVDVL
ncbi:hypothetical protein COV06_04060 [Candidatus Uhrbacteria bacterium CG10_big_fil_rev_8_21_14_0_10_50_16]|uniref:Uncharacterized protein n=1 Tax=Candidatus Uhrbacteria bacterium CG10_big_fil_rev_8_21_14_0_10_50_16 TaxID=1975039 RepID=A0A2H0RNJ9_9BACT|nr:MAG: hypothetical protein COV06_04060 [Candidatus Uhrbacteria bacterium CG10_big_fil_rev_8_21_14_0_10_50_16]